VRFLLTTVAVGALTACVTLEDVDRTLNARRPPAYLALTGDVRFAPGTASKLPVHSSPIVEPLVVLDACDMHSVVRVNNGYQEEVLKGNWLSGSIWIALHTTREQYRHFPLVHVLSQSGYRYASIAFEDISLQVMDTNQTTYEFVKRHPTWQIKDYSEHFGQCPAVFDVSGLYIVHQVLMATMHIKLHGIFGWSVNPPQSLVEKMTGLGFRFESETREFVSMTPWSISRYSRLKLNTLGFFTGSDVVNSEGATDYDYQ